MYTYDVSALYRLILDKNHSFPQKYLFYIFSSFSPLSVKTGLSQTSKPPITLASYFRNGLKKM